MDCMNSMRDQLAGQRKRIAELDVEVERRKTHELSALEQMATARRAAQDAQCDRDTLTMLGELQVDEFATGSLVKRLYDRCKELEGQLERQTPFALDWRDALDGVARDLGMPPATSLAADVRPAVAIRLAGLAAARTANAGLSKSLDFAATKSEASFSALQLIATEAAAMLAETNHGGLSFARRESMRKALEAAAVPIPPQCTACPHPPPKPYCACGAPSCDVCHP
jgi:hypothetical protein